MAKEVEISTLNPHPAQESVLDNCGRFNVLRNGRRWGKSALGVYLAQETMIDGFPVGAFFPTFDFAEEFWEELKDRLEPIISYKSESKHIIKLITGGSLKIWSLEKARAGRGKKYKRVLVDEGAFAKDLKESWTKAIRPTLTDYVGDAWFLSTPNGTLNYFHELDQLSKSKKHEKNWRSFHMPTHTNPYISEAELNEIKEQLDELTWLQEFMAEYVNFAGKPFAYSFEEKKHVGKTGPPLISLPLDLSFDFNVDPITCTVQQHNEDKSWIKFYKEFRLTNSDIYQLCDAIIAEYGDSYYLRVTGDASGNNRSAMVGDNLNYYKIIIKKLKLEDQLFVPAANPLHRNSRVLTNSLFRRHTDIIIDEEGCPFLIADLKFVECNETGEIDKKKDKYKGHLIDCLRYYFNTWHSDFLRKYNENSD